MGWGDAPGADTDELVHCLARFDPEGLAQALGRDEDHTHWFKTVCDALLPHYMYSLDLGDRDPLAPGPLPTYMRHSKRRLNIRNGPKNLLTQRISDGNTRRNIPGDY